MRRCFMVQAWIAVVIGVIALAAVLVAVALYYWSIVNPF